MEEGGVVWGIKAGIFELHQAGFAHGGSYHVYYSISSSVFQPAYFPYGNSTALRVGTYGH